MHNLFITIFRASLLPNNGDQIVKKLYYQILTKIAKITITLLPLQNFCSTKKLQDDVYYDDDEDLLIMSWNKFWKSNLLVGWV